MQDLEENNRIVKSIDLFKKSGDTRGTLRAKMGTILDRKFKDLIEADENKKRWQECTELYKKGHNDWDRDDAVVTHMKANILVYEVNWALGSITTGKAAREGDEIPDELFKISKE